MRDEAAIPRWLPALTIAVLAWLVLFPIVSVDAHYHLATGRRILEDRSIPARGVGSATFGDRPWHDNEWGFQLLAALVAGWEMDGSVWVLTKGGILRLMLLRALCLAATLALLSAQMARSGVDPLTRSVALALAAFLTFGNLFWAIRPQILSYLALAAVAYLLQRHREGSVWAVWTVLPVIAIWANVHGAFVVGIALLLAEAAGETVDAWRSRECALVAGARRLWVVLLLAPLAACLNPHGYHQVVHPFLYVLHPEIHRGNLEWTRPDFLHLPLFMLTLALLVLALASRGGLRLADLFRCLGFTILLFSAIRHLPMAALILVPVLAASAAAAARRGGWRTNLEPTGPGWGGPGVRSVAAILLIGAIVALSGAFTRSQARFVTLWPRTEVRAVGAMPERAVRFLAQRGIEGSIFNGYRFGGFLMFRLYPEERVFMDGRNDLYGTFRDDVYNRILDTRAGWRSAWESHSRELDVGSVLIDESDGLCGALREDPEWFPASGEDGIIDGESGRDGIVLLLRNTAENRRRASGSTSESGER